MKVCEVIENFEQLVPFPISPEKIAVAGYNVTSYLKDITEQLSQCEDLAEYPEVIRVVEAGGLLKELDAGT